jgi:hypothetical protein
MIDINSTIYGAVALIGALLYVYAGWKAKDPPEPFNLQKVFDSLRSGGLVSIIIAAVGLAANGLRFELLISAFVIGLGMDAGLGAASNALTKKAKKSEEIVINQSQ